MIELIAQLKDRHGLKVAVVMKAYEECLSATSTDDAPGTSSPPTTRRMLA
jgi:hypothetical protein